MYNLFGQSSWCSLSILTGLTVPNSCFVSGRVSVYLVHSVNPFAPCFLCGLSFVIRMDVLFQVWLYDGFSSWGFIASMVVFAVVY